jgi:transposase
LVGDRFHLVQNLHMAIEEQMSLAGRATGRSILNEEDNIDAAAHRRHGRLAHRRTRKEVFEAIHALRDKGATYSEIARRTGYKRRTVAKWLTFKTSSTSASTANRSGRTRLGQTGLCRDVTDHDSLWPPCCEPLLLINYSRA